MSENVTIAVNMTIPGQYAEFWEKFRTFYDLPEDALHQVASEQFIRYLNMMHDDLASQPVIGICPGEIKKTMEV